MRQNSRTTLRNAILTCGDVSLRFLTAPDTAVAFADAARGSILGSPISGSRAHELFGRTVLIATSAQLLTALCLIELDGVARRVVLYPPGIAPEHLSGLVASAAIDAVVSDGHLPELTPLKVPCFTCSAEKIASADYDRGPRFETEWVLLTSGTTGAPKLVAHTLESLAGAIDPCGAPPKPIVWSTFYDIRRYGGLQIFLRACLTGGSLVLSGEQESTAGFLARAGACEVTHISGTPSHWRRALMSPCAHAIKPRYVRLSGEIADQTILNNLRSFYPDAKISHAFASTEAGVAFDINDGFAGFPARVVENTANVQMRVENDTLRIRSNRTAAGYLGAEGHALKDAEGFVDTGDLVELRDDRYYFVGRRDGIIKVGGLKVSPEEVETVINRHPEVQMSLVRTKKSPITGALVVADVVLKEKSSDPSEMQRNILQFCRAALPAHKIPAAIRFVSALAVAETGKIMRRYA